MADSILIYGFVVAVAIMCIAMLTWLANERRKMRKEMNKPKMPESHFIEMARKGGEPPGGYSDEIKEMFAREDRKREEEERKKEDTPH